MLKKCLEALESPPCFMVLLGCTGAMRKQKPSWGFLGSPTSMRSCAPAIGTARCTGWWLHGCGSTASCGPWNSVATGSKTSRPTTEKPGAAVLQAPAPSIRRWMP